MNFATPRIRQQSRWLLLLVVLLALNPLLSACSNGESSAGHDMKGMKMAALADMPEEVKSAPVTVREAYQFAVANPDALKNVPCYCGCGAAGHTSNFSCYVQEVKPDGSVVFDQHALGCSICVDITQDVMQMTRAGKPPEEIRAAIDDTYAKFGPSNMPPAP